MGRPPGASKQNSAGGPASQAKAACPCLKTLNGFVKYHNLSLVIILAVLFRFVINPRERISSINFSPSIDLQISVTII